MTFGSLQPLVTLICGGGALYCYYAIQNVLDRGIQDIQGLTYINNCSDQFTRVNKDLFIRKLVLTTSSLQGLKIEIIALFVLILVNALTHIPLIYKQYTALTEDEKKVLNLKKQHKKEVVKLVKELKAVAKQTKIEAEKAAKEEKAAAAAEEKKKAEG